MAQQHLVRVLVPAEDAAELRDELLLSNDLDVLDVAVETPRPGTYRDERPDRRLHELVVRGGGRVVLGAVGGAVLGILVVLVVPYLREWLPWTLLLGAGGGAWAGAITLAARGVQVDKDADDVPERLHRVGPEDSPHQRALTITVGRDRNPVEQLLGARGYVLLDSTQPRLDGPG